MLIFLSALMGAGTIIPGFIKLRDLEKTEATEYLKDRNNALAADIERARSVLEKAGVFEVESYKQNAIEELSAKYTSEEPDPRVSSFVIDLEDNIIVSWYSKDDMPSSSEIIEIAKQRPDGELTYAGFTESWNAVKQTDEGWQWKLVTFMSDQEMFRESWSYFWFVITVAIAVLAVVLLIYFVLTGRFRDRFTATIDKIDRYNATEIEEFIEVDGTDEIGVLQESVNTMIQKIGDEIETRKETEKALKTAKEEAEEANRAKSLFLANMSHEIRNPLNAIVGFSDVLAKTELSEQQSEFAENISQAGKVLSATLSDVLDISKIESGSVAVTNEAFSVRDEVNGLIAMYSLQADEKGLEMHCEIKEEVPDLVHGDKTHLAQILNNLVQNAIKFTTEGSVSIHIEIINESVDFCRLGITVSDTGIGIKEEEQRWIFETFSQAKSTRPYSLSGVGLGLSIVKKLVQLLGGSISLSSKPKVGSSFLVELPFLKPSSKEQRQNPLKEDRHGEFSNIQALIVDDDVLNQAYMGEVLKSNGISYVKAENGKKAIEIIESQHIDIMLMDIRMPVMGGMETLKFIRRYMDPPNSNIPIIIVTANVFAKDIKGYIEAGADDCINKPARSEEIIATIQKVLNKDEADSESSPLSVDESASEKEPVSEKKAIEF